MTLSDDRVSMAVIGFCDDGSDESIASPLIAETSVLKALAGGNELLKSKYKLYLNKVMLRRSLLSLVYGASLALHYTCQVASLRYTILTSWL